MRLHRFYIEQPLGEELVVVEKELVHQWISVFRYKSGDEVILFSSANVGVDYIYSISSASKTEVALSFVSQKKNITPTRNITLCMAVVKKDTFENIVRHATELGVSKIIPILASRSEKKNLNLERLNTIIRESAEQSGRGGLPTISEIVPFKEAFNNLNSGTSVFMSLNGENTHSFINKLKPNEEINVWIGPEGGWTDSEEAYAKDMKAEMIKLTDTVLRADTAAICALSTMVLV